MYTWLKKYSAVTIAIVITMSTILGINISKVSADASCSATEVSYGASYATKSYTAGNFCIQQNGAKFVYQTDGNLVSYVNGHPYFDSKTNNSAGAHGIFKLQQDGNMVIYGANNKVLWASNTSIKSGNFDLYLVTGSGGNGSAEVFSYARNSTVWMAY